MFVDPLLALAGSANKDQLRGLHPCAGGLHCMVARTAFGLATLACRLATTTHGLATRAITVDIVAANSVGPYNPKVLPIFKFNIINIC